MGYLSCLLGFLAVVEREVVHNSLVGCLDIVYSSNLLHQIHETYIHALGLL
jgi:hypothetical protein